MNFSKTTSYSLSVLSFMARDPDMRMSARYLHDMISIPYSYLRQILNELSKSGFICSTKGRNGGFIFMKTTDTILLADIIDATEGLESFERCIMGFTECPFDEKCPMHKVWEKTRKKILNVLKKTSLSDIIKK